MNAEWIITVFVILDELLAKGGHQDHHLFQVGDSEVLTVAIVAAKHFQNHQERALLMMRECHYLSGNLSVALQPPPARLPRVVGGRRRGVVCSGAAR